MKKTIFFALLFTVTLFSFADSGKPVPTAFEIKSDALIDEIEFQFSQNQTDPDFSAMRDLLDWLIKQPNFQNQWAAYISGEQTQRPATPIACIGSSVLNYASCVSYYNQWCNNNGIMQLCHGPVPPSPSPNLNHCEYQLLLSVGSCF